LSWHWVFLINIPVGIIALTGIQLSVRDGEGEERDRPFDLAGFAFLAIAIGTLQLILERGNSQSWFHSTEIQVEALLVLLAVYLFLVQIFTRDQPFIEPAIFRDRNFSLSVILSVAIGFNLMATMAILPPFMQSLLGFPVLATGWILAPRGVGTMVSMWLVGRLVGRIDARVLIITGLALMALSMWQMSLFDHNVTAGMLAWTGMLQGFGMGCMFVPMSSVAFATLEPRYRTDGSGLYSLARNIGSSIGIAILMGALAVYVRENREVLVTHINPFNALLNNLNVAMFDPGNPAGLEMLNGLVQREALMLGYLDDFRLMMIVTLATMPLVLILRPPRQPAQ
jgi:DHA2 family multidrug resistance protein